MAGGSILRMTARIETGGFDRLLQGVRDGLDAGLEALADLVVQEAQASTAFRDRRKSGRGLRKSIRKYRDKETGQWYVRAGGVKGVYQAHLVEFGHDLVSRDGRKIGHVDAHPFLAPAADKVLGAGAEEVVKRMIEDRTIGIEVPIK